jgi:hypothetical protein
MKSLQGDGRAVPDQSAHGLAHSFCSSSLVEEVVGLGLLTDTNSDWRRGGEEVGARGGGGQRWWWREVVTEAEDSATSLPH